MVKWLLGSKWIVNIIKRQIIKLAWRELDKGQILLRSAWKTGGKLKVNQVFDEIQVKIIHYAVGLPFTPDWLDRKMAEVVQSQGDVFQKELNRLIERNSDQALDLIDEMVDQYQKLLEQRILAW